MLLTIILQSGKPHFGYIYGVGLLGSASLYILLNLMSETGIDAYRVVSVLGYCLLPMVGVAAVSVVTPLKYASFSTSPMPRSEEHCLNHSGIIGLMLSFLSIVWCTASASGIFVVVLRMSEQRLLVAYPIALLYGCFALLSVFNVEAGSGSSSK